MTKEVFESIMQGMKEAIAHARGEIELPERIVIPPGRGYHKGVPRDLPDPEREYPGILIPTYRVLEAEPEQRAPPKRKGVGSNPSEDSNFS